MARLESLFRGSVKKIGSDTVGLAEVCNAPMIVPLTDILRTYIFIYFDESDSDREESVEPIELREEWIGIVDRTHRRAAILRLMGIYHENELVSDGRS